MYLTLFVFFMFTFKVSFVANVNNTEVEYPVLWTSLPHFEQ